MFLLCLSWHLYLQMGNNEASCQERMQSAYFISFLVVTSYLYIEPKGLYVSLEEKWALDFRTRECENWFHVASQQGIQTLDKCMVE